MYRILVLLGVVIASIFSVASAYGPHYRDALPDLFMYFGQVSQSIDGRTETVHLTIQNKGAAFSRAQSVRIACHHSGIVRPDTYLGGRTIRIPAHSTRDITTTVRLATNNQRTYYACYIDPDDRILESNEGNNKTPGWIHTRPKQYHAPAPRAAPHPRKPKCYVPPRNRRPTPVRPTPLPRIPTPHPQPGCGAKGCGKRIIRTPTQPRQGCTDGRCGQRIIRTPTQPRNGCSGGRCGFVPLPPIVSSVGRQSSSNVSSTRSTPTPTKSYRSQAVNRSFQRGDRTY